MAIQYNPFTGFMTHIDTADIQTFETTHRQGLAVLDTTPIANPVAGDWYTAQEQGVYTYFGNITANPGDRIIYDAGAWKVVPITAVNFKTYSNTDPATLGNPPAGQMWDGTWNGRKWLKDETGEINYLLTEAEFYALTS
jgi:hypothetical protein